MIGQKELKDYGFSQIENYFDYITESRINGQHFQAKELFNKMNRQQKAQALKYFLCGYGEYCDDYERRETLQWLINNEVIL